MIEMIIDNVAIDFFSKILPLINFQNKFDQRF